MWLLNNALISFSTGRYSTKTGQHSLGAYSRGHREVGHTGLYKKLVAATLKVHCHLSLLSFLYVLSPDITTQLPPECDSGATLPR